MTYQQNFNTLLRYTLQQGFAHIGHVTHADPAVLQSLLSLQQHISHHPLKFQRIVHRLAISQTRSYFSWIATVPQIALYIIIRFGPLWLLNQYLDSQPLAVESQDNPLIHAAQFDRLPFAEILLSRGLDVNKQGIYLDGYGRASFTIPLKVAVIAQREAFVSLFLARGSQVPRDIVHDALQWDDPSFPAIVRALLHHGADVTLSSNGGRALLNSLLGPWRSSEEVCLETAQLLAEAGSPLNTQDERGHTPLHLAALNGYTTVVRYLLERGAGLPIDIIHVAVQNTKPSYKPILQMLVKRGADVNSLTRSGNSALHTLLQLDTWTLQFETFCLAAIQALVDFGCNQFSIENNRGLTPLQLAIDNRYPVIAAYLLDKGTSLGTLKYLHLDNLHWAVNAPWYAEALTAGREFLARRLVTDHDVNLVTKLFTHNLMLPAQVVRRILNNGEYWSCASVVHHDLDFNTSDGVLHLPLPQLPEEPGKPSVHRVVFSCIPVEGE
ncbi:hypothetical protein HYDPIDRAFT_166955 [Hydnomerulius pinastri MD-312]|nr:hypothetical protein HYDPIDRAFT_166955 [Hydnomerulius pinastri MD-312]